MAHLADQFGVTDDLKEVLETQPFQEVPWIRAGLLALDGDFGGAADVFATMGNPAYEARMRLRIGESCVHREQADDEVERALAFYRSVGATYFIRRGEALLAESAYSDSA